MKTLLSLCISILAATVLLSYLPVHGEEEIYDNVVRLHVIAESDTEEDQAVKLLVRDRVLELVGERLESVTDCDSALAVLEEMKEDIKDCAETVTTEAGADGIVSVELGVESYPVRYYDGYTLPAGEYKSLRIKLGEGRGRNWWCILFPSVCVSDATETKRDYVAAGFTPDQYRLIENGNGRKYKVRFKILEVLSGIMGFEY